MSTASIKFHFCFTISNPSFVYCNNSEHNDEEVIRQSSCELLSGLPSANVGLKWQLLVLDEKFGSDSDQRFENRCGWHVYFHTKFLHLVCFSRWSAISCITCSTYSTFTEGSCPPSRVNILTFHWALLPRNISGLIYEGWSLDLKLAFSNLR